MDKPINKMWFNRNTNSCYISTRSNVKNYTNSIEKFLLWIKPYIERGSGELDMYAIVMTEECETPKIYYLKSE